MGKYMRKAKITGDVAVMELSQSFLGVRTRAKTQALLRLHNAQQPQDSEPAYLELRSRRLQKPPPSQQLGDARKQPQAQNHPTTKVSCRQSPNTNPSSGGSSRLPSEESVGPVSLCGAEGEEGCFGNNVDNQVEDVGVEASFAENYLDFEVRDRSTRESTPSSLIRSSDTIGTPGSTTRQTSSTATYRVQNARQRNIPTSIEMEEFFAYAERQQQLVFTEKYNFDVVNDLPLPGRYEWVLVNP